MSIYWAFGSFLVGFSFLTNSKGTPLLQAEPMTSITTKSINSPQIHILNLVKQNRMSAKKFELDDSFNNFDEFEKYNDLNGLRIGATKSVQRSQKIEAKTDDLLNNDRNTLENTNDEFSRLRNNSNSGFYLRFKQSIPVLEPVRHLLNTVREGGFNHTTHFNKTRHQLIGAGEIGGGSGFESSTASSAIETEAERDMVLHGRESTSFQFLDLFGSIGSMIWGFLMNIKKWITTASGNASAAVIGGSF